MNKAKDIDFLFLLVRSEFADFVAPMLPAMNAAGFSTNVVRLADNPEIPPLNPRVVITSNETPLIFNYPNAKKVLLGHSIYLRDTTATLLDLGRSDYLNYDYYFCPSAYYLEWTLKGLFAAATYAPKDVEYISAKTLIPGGYVKPFRRPSHPTEGLASFGVKEGKKVVLYVPSVYNPALDKGHQFHRDGGTIAGLLLMESLRRQGEVFTICRPHPTDHKYPHLQQMLSSYSGMDNIHFDLNPTPHPALYYSPDVLITDMSGFGFAYALATGRRPIFHVEKDECEREPRFHKLASRFGRITHDFSMLIDTVRSQLDGDDRLGVEDMSDLQSIFYDRHNHLHETVEDLKVIITGAMRPHWLKMQPAFLGWKDQG